MFNWLLSLLQHKIYSRYLYFFTCIDLCTSILSPLKCFDKLFLILPRITKLMHLRDWSKVFFFFQPFFAFVSLYFKRCVEVNIFISKCRFKTNRLQCNNNKVKFWEWSDKDEKSSLVDRKILKINLMPLMHITKPYIKQAILLLINTNF